MDLKEYISSGIIERYVLNSVSQQEKQEVECMSHIYPEIRAELYSLQSTIEQLVMKSAVPAPAHLKELILNRIANEKQDHDLEKADTTKVIPLRTESKTYKYLAAACFTGIIALGIYTSKINGDSSDLQQKLTAQESTILELESLTDLTNEQLAFIKDKATDKVLMNGTESHPGLLATVFWNTDSEKVMMEIQNLPANASDKQYQLWAIIDGTPADMGVFDVNDSKSGLIEMKNANNAVAFAVTLEPKGGSKIPTLDQMYVIGNV